MWLLELAAHVAHALLVFCHLWPYVYRYHYEGETMPPPATMPDPRDRDYRREDGTLIVHWRPSICQHCEACVNGLPTVFDLSRRPWVAVNAEPMERIVEQIDQCPHPHALSYSFPEKSDDPDQRTLFPS